MSFRLTVILLVVLVALGAAVFFVDQSPATPTPSASSTTIVSFLASDAAELSATSKSQSVLVVKDATEGWLLKQPEAASADQLRVESTLSQLASLPATRTIATPGDLAQFGLAEPAVEVKVKLKSGDVKSLLVGDPSPDKGSYYVKLPDKGEVYLVPAAIGADLAQLAANPPKATPTPTAEPTAGPGTPAPAAAGTPTIAPSTSAAIPAVPPTPARPGVPTPESIPQLPEDGVGEIPDVPLPPEALTPVP